MTEFREASPDDLPQILRWTLELYQHEDEGDIEPHKNFEQNLEKWLAFELNNPNSLFLIAQVENQAIGFCSATSIINDNGLIKAPLKGIIQLLWIEPAFRARQIASELVKHCEECLRTAGAGYIECSYTSSNQLARQFWRRSGYKEASVTARKLLK